MALRVGIDATAWRNPRGDGRFVRNAVRRLVALHPEVEWLLVVDAGDDDGGFPEAVRLRPVRFGRAPVEALSAESARSPRDLLRLWRSVRPGEVNAFLSPSVYSYFPVRAPALVGLHDANAVLRPELVLPTRRARVLWSVKQRVALRRAARLFTVSEAARSELCRALGLQPAEVAVVPEAPDPAFASRPAEAVSSVLGRHGLSREEGYFLFSAGISPHKGLDTLVDAYAAVRRERPAAPPLVIAGALAGPYASAGGDLRERIAASGIETAAVLTGFVPDEELACLYTGATAAVVPSLGEGFGLPAVEAAACGAPSVLSDIGPHRETLGDAALFFPPGDADALRGALRRLLDDRRLGLSLADRARAAAGRLSWDEAAGRLHALLMEAAAG
jgi:glycosyltransferase involved in cell wall biosynthesis